MFHSRKWVLLCVCVAIAAGCSKVESPKRVPASETVRLEVEVISRPTQIGIPGITKMYEALLKNEGTSPVKVRVCDAVDDGMHRHIYLAHTIERWDSESRRWKAFWQIPSQEFCRPYPTGIINGQIVDVSLDPGRSLSTGEIAIQAADNLQLGDRLRFVVFPYSDVEKAWVASPDFLVDERPARR
jgi:hypothetical protein